MGWRRALKEAPGQVQWRAGRHNVTTYAGCYRPASPLPLERDEMSGWSSPTKIRKKFRLNCERKIGHDTHASAFAAMEEVRQAGKLYDQTALVYLCRRCGKYHWGRPMNEGQMALANGQIGPNPPYKPSP